MPRFLLLSLILICALPLAACDSDDNPPDTWTPSLVVSLNLPDPGQPGDATGIARIRTNTGAFSGMEHLPENPLGFAIGKDHLIIDSFEDGSLQTASIVYHWETTGGFMLTQPVTVTPPFNHEVPQSEGRKAHFSLEFPPGT